MKLELEVQYLSGEAATYVAAVPEWVKWERKFNATVNEAESKLGLEGLTFLAYHAMKRESAGKAVKPYEIWCEGVLDVKVGEADPKVMNAEV